MVVMNDDGEPEEAARFHAYNEFLKHLHTGSIGEAFAAGWKAGVEYRDGQERESATEAISK